MTKTIQLRVDSRLKDAADTLFFSLGLDTSTAIRMFLVASLESSGIPFAVVRKEEIGAKSAMTRNKRRDDSTQQWSAAYAQAVLAFESTNDPSFMEPIELSHTTKEGLFD